MAKFFTLLWTITLVLFSSAAIADWFLSAEVKELMKKAVAGDVPAQMQVAIAYDSGKGAPRDLKEATKWYQLAANQGFAEAQNSLGSLLQGDKKYGEALSWFEKASAQGHALATNNLAYLYDLGLGVPQNRQKGVELYLRAADLGWAESMWNLANVYGAGQLGKVDMISACTWAMRAQKYAGNSNNERRLRNFVAQAIPKLEQAMSPEDLASCKKDVDRWVPLVLRNKDVPQAAAPTDAQQTTSKP